MKEPAQCGDINEIRFHIDAIDKQIIHLIGKRAKYVKVASRFKVDEEAVKAPERLKSMLLQRRSWAAMEALDANVIEKMYRDLVNYFINEELNDWKIKNENE